MNESWEVVLLTAAAGAAAGVAVRQVVHQELNDATGGDRLVLGVATAGGWAATTAFFGWSWSLPTVLYLVVLAAALTVTDIRQHRLPNRLVLGSYPVVAALLMLSVADHHSWTALLQAVGWGAGLFAVFLLIFFVGGIGAGDVKLSGLIGAWLGWAGGGEGVAVGLVVTAISAAVVTAVALATGHLDRRSNVAYGPFLLLGAVVGVAVTLS